MADRFVPTLFKQAVHFFCKFYIHIGNLILTIVEDNTAITVPNSVKGNHFINIIFLMMHSSKIVRFLEKITTFVG